MRQAAETGAGGWRLPQGMQRNGNQQDLRAGTAGGLLPVLLQVRADEVIQTICLAAVGAFVSFSVSLFLRWLTGRLKRKR